MEIVAAVAASALGYACQNVPAAQSWLGSLCSPQYDDLKKLKERLSSAAEIYLPGSDGFDAATTRWSVLDVPNITIVIVPSVESDVAEAVKFANARKVPFLAVNAGHGAITTQGRVRNGVEIWLNKLNTVEISKDGTTARIGGGALTKSIIDALWAAGKQTMTGFCECTSLLGPGLGGGHGALQGRHGLVADQFVSMNVVLADGTMQTIDETSDLWWAMKGAGHNFGIVTSVTSKIYDIKHPDWAHETLVFTGGHVEDIYGRINEHLLKNGTQPVDVMHHSFYLNNPEVDPKRPLVILSILQEGVKAVDSTYTEPFHMLGPIAIDSAAGRYIDLPGWLSSASESPACQKAGLVNLRFPIDLLTYNVEAQRKVYDLFMSVTQETPALNNSMFLFEGYSLQGVQAVASESTAYPFRGDNLLISPLIVYQPDGPKLDKKAAEFGEDLRQELYKASRRSELHAYVNYAFGDETTRNWYGYEQWRQDKLLALKRKYDPHGRFNFYAPIRVWLFGHVARVLSKDRAVVGIMTCHRLRVSLVLAVSNVPRMAALNDKNCGLSHADVAHDSGGSHEQPSSGMYHIVTIPA
ncbi:FAD-linked oxidoreductase chyH [Cladobotryum mycophilum]|uniref:FAD-linked oxidoreductase chyH n=1 Tax=Cladobotryum mycophilum TaxID=491253 RepID=A0ABR0SN60_9HYPO